MSFLSSKGSQAQIARITNADSVAVGRSNVQATSSAITGITTYIALIDFNSKTGRCQRYMMSSVVATIPMAKISTEIDDLSSISNIV